MYFEQVYDSTLAQASYFVGCQAKGEAIVIDAKRDIDSYLQIAQANQMRITHIVETHIHADFLSGSRELAQQTGAQLYLSDEGGVDWQYEFPHIGLRENAVIKVGNLTFTVIHTPGHTPESISLLLRDHPASNEPVMLFSGDFVFVGDVGRPDLLEEAAGVQGAKDIGAEQLFSSLAKFRALPDYVQVWPGHGAGSACGKALGSVPSSTVGYEKIRNWAFQYGDNFDAFKAELLSGQPEAPRYFAVMKKLNRVERPLLTSVPQHPTLTVDTIPADALLVDSRDKTTFAAGHLPRALNIQHNKTMSTWAGWMLNYQQPIVVVAEPGHEMEITRKLMRIGIDHIVGFVHYDPAHMQQESVILDAEQVAEMKDLDSTTLIDVRNSKEYQAAHIQGAHHYFVGHLPKQLPALDPEQKIIVLCQAGDRATVAASYLRSAGFKHVMNYQGSMKDWLSKGYPVVASS